MLTKEPNFSIKLYLSIVLTFGISLIKGGAPHWVSLFWTALCGLALFASLFDFDSRRDNSVRLKLKAKDFLAAISILLFQVWTVLQMYLFGVDKIASLNQSIIGIGFLLLLTLWFTCIRQVKSLNMLYLGVIGFTMTQAVYGLWIFISDVNLLLWMPKLYYLDRPTGFFVNANHFAAYLALGFILCMSHTIVNNEKHRQKSFFLLVLDSIYSPKFFVLGFFLITLISTKSMGSIVALSVVFSLMMLNFIRKSKYKLLLLSVLTIIVLIFIMIVLSIDYAIIENQLADLSHTFSRRIDLNIAALNMLKDTWSFGIGGGSFYSQFSQYRTIDVGNTYYNYAHNDWIQFWIEYGIIGISLLIIFIMAVIRDNLWVLKQRATVMQKTFAYASLYSIAYVAIHSLVDFPLHIPGFTALFLVIISINSLKKMSDELFIDVDQK